MVSSWGWQHGLGFDLTSITKDVLVIGSWTWQAEWYIKYPPLATITNPALVHNAISRLIWKTMDDTDKEFSLASVWDTIRPKGTVIDWHDIVWDHVKIYDSLPIVADSLDSIVTYLIPIYRKRSARSVITKLVMPQAPKRNDFHVNDEKHELEDHGEPANYRDTLSESDKWLKIMNDEM
ncbi:hypothetical protein Tco_1440572 [Tanacetum coccineum]